MKVRLSHGELMVAAFVGVMRQIAANKNNSEPGYGIDEIGWTENIEGAAAEMAFAKGMKLWWTNMIADRSNKRPDVGKWEVRNGTKDYYCMCVRKKDDDDTPVALVTGSNGEYTIRGWMYAKDAKRQEWWRTWVRGRACNFWVPQSALTPFDVDAITER